MDYQDMKQVNKAKQKIDVSKPLPNILDEMFCRIYLLGLLDEKNKTLVNPLDEVGAYAHSHGRYQLRLSKCDNTHARQTQQTQLGRPVYLIDEKMEANAELIAYLPEYNNRATLSAGGDDTSTNSNRSSTIRDNSSTSNLDIYEIVLKEERRSSSSNKKGNKPKSSSLHNIYAYHSKKLLIKKSVSARILYLQTRMADSLNITPALFKNELFRIYKECRESKSHTQAINALEKLAALTGVSMKTPDQSEVKHDITLSWKEPQSIENSTKKKEPPSNDNQAIPIGEVTDFEELTD